MEPYQLAASASCLVEMYEFQPAEKWFEFQQFT